MIPKREYQYLLGKKVGVRIGHQRFTVKAEGILAEIPGTYNLAVMTQDGWVEIDPYYFNLRDNDDGTKIFTAYVERGDEK